jgi:hypothetical protein
VSAHASLAVLLVSISSGSNAPSWRAASVTVQRWIRRCPVDADVIFVTEGRDREINARCAIRARLSFGVFDRPARIAVLLPQLGRLACPRCRDAAFFDVTLSPSVLRCLGVAMIEASMIWPLIARKPAAASAASKRSNTTLIAGWAAILARVSASRKAQIVLASGTVSASPRPRNRMNDSRSRIRYSVRSSDRLWWACRMSVLNIST